MRLDTYGELDPSCPNCKQDPCECCEFCGAKPDEDCTTECFEERMLKTLEVYKK